MRVLLVSEGEHERAGALESLVTRLAPKIVQCTWDYVRRSNIHVHHGKGKGYFKKAVSWLLEARKRGFDALVFVIDRDKDRQRVEQIDQAQAENTVTGAFPRALGVAIPTFDAWMLADEQALCAVIGAVVPTQRAPEDNYGAKEACAAIMKANNCQLSQRKFYEEVANAINLQRLEQRCPQGFGKFATRVRALEAAVFGA